MEFRNNTILITGGTSGFGYEIRDLSGLSPCFVNYEPHCTGIYIETDQ